MSHLRPNWIVVLLAAFAFSSVASAHPVPSLAYDHTVLVYVKPKGVEIRYRLDVESVTVQFDLRHLLSKEEFAGLRSEADIYTAFRKTIGPMIADRLIAFQGDKNLPLEAGESWLEIVDHLQFTLVFRTKWIESLEHEPRFRLEIQRPFSRGESYFEQEKGRLDLSLLPGPGVILKDRDEPPAALKIRTLPECTEAEKNQLSRIGARVTLSPDCAIVGGSGGGLGLAAWEFSSEQRPIGREALAPQTRHGIGLHLSDLLNSQGGFVLTLAIAILFGAAHALTPGHGKTLVAAYLVGQRGTVGHAVLLGAVTTITHTGVVLVVAAVLPLLASRIDPSRMQEILGFAGGFLIAGMGLWLLLRRLSGAADHVHIGGGHHHHHVDHHHHDMPAQGKVRFWDLVVLGVSGGIVPCWDAIALLGLAIATHRLWLGLPLLLAFSAGLAGVLVLIGVLVVKLKGFGSSRWGSGRITRSLPLVSAIVITAIGIWLCFDSLPNR